MEKGMARGVAKVARNMLAQGIGIDIISKTTGLSAAEISSLDKQPDKK